MRSLMAIVVEQVHAPTDDLRLLIGELDAELSGPYSPDQRHGLTLARLFEPNMFFFIARLDGSAVGCGGIAVDEQIAELKRMYVRPHARGRAVAQTLLARLEEVARAHDIRRLVLETGDAQHAALRFYERAGFTRCAPFGAYAAMPPPAIERSVFFEKQIG